MISRLHLALLAVALGCAFCCVASSAAAQTQLSASPAALAQVSQAEAPCDSAYNPPPEIAAKAIALARDSHLLYFADFGYEVIVLLLLLRFRMAPRFRDLAERAGGNRFVQALVFAPLLLITLGVLALPDAIAGHWLSRRFGLSVQGWLSWLWDQAKGGALTLILAVVLVWLVYAVIRRSRRRWWLYVWLGSLPVLVFFTFLEPLVFEPLFYRYTPLAAADPGLAAQLERVVQHAGEALPESRMFLMNASAKLTVLNAYMTGIGASRRIVVWDTTLARLSTPEILFVFGHEMGHYVLGHITQGMLFATALLLAAFWLAFHFLRWALGRFGAAWGIRGMDDWASLVPLLLFLLLFDFASAPLGNAFSRRLEHQADQYGLEVTHGIVPDAPEAAAASFEILGEVDLDPPSPARLTVLWFYTHPPIAERMRFACSYDPWTRGESPRWVR